MCFNHLSYSQSILPCAYAVGRVEWHINEGETFQPVKHIATVRGKARHLLLGERVALNMLARCSGIATKCDPTTIHEMECELNPKLGRSKRIHDLARGYGYKGVIAGTRKTTPGEYLRSL